MAVAELPPLLVFAVTLSALFLLLAYRATLGAMLNALANALHGISIPYHFGAIHPFGPIVSLLDAIDNATRYALAKVVDANQYAWHEFVHWHAYVWHKLTEAVADVAESAEQAFATVRHQLIPTLIGVAVGPLAAEIELLRKLLGKAGHVTKVITHEVTHVIRATPTIVRPVTVEHITKIVRAQAVTLPQAIPNPWPRVRDIESSLSDAWGRLRGIGRTLAPAAVAGLVASALFTLRAGWLKCANVKRVGEAACGMNPTALEALLAETALVLGTVSLVEFAEGMGSIVGEIAEPVASFWRA